LESSELSGSLEPGVISVFLVLLAALELLEPLDILAFKDPLVCAAPLVQVVTSEPLALLDLQGLLDHRDPRVAQASPVLLGLPGILALSAVQARVDLVEKQATLGPKDPTGQLGTLDQLDQWVKKAVQVFRVTLERLDSLVSMDYLELLERPGHLAVKEAPATLAIQGFKGLLELEVTLERLVLVEPRELLDLLELPDHRDSRDSQVSSVSTV
jgi:hypothetical protein